MKIINIIITFFSNGGRDRSYKFELEYRYTPDDAKWKNQSIKWLYFDIDIIYKRFEWA